jgi:hypothetical protein
MRRVTGLVLSALGAFLIVLAVLTRLVVVGDAVKYPLNEHSVFSLSASNVNYFSPALLSEETGVTMEDTTTVVGDNAAGSSSTAVWNGFNYLYDETNKQPFEYTSDRLAFNRRTGELVSCCGAAIGNNDRLHMSGLGDVWPIGSKKQSYEVYNTNLLRPELFKYAGTATVDGETTYKYVNRLTAARAGSETLPGSLVGIKTPGEVKLPEYFTGTTIEWVDPITGAPVKVQDGEHVYLTDSAGTEVLNLFDGTLASTPSSIASAVSTAKSYDTEVALVEVVIPLIAALIGIILLVTGILLARTPRAEDGEEQEEEEETELEGGPVTT